MKKQIRQFRVRLSEVEWLFMRRMRNCLNLFNLEKHNYEKKCINQLRIDKLLLDETKILDYVTD